MWLHVRMPDTTLDVAPTQMSLAAQSTIHRGFGDGDNYGLADGNGVTPWFRDVLSGFPRRMDDLRTAALNVSVQPLYKLKGR